ncbi:MAG: protein phosphatase 2C domain-containing protein [Nocardiopsaceae bacterium]|nr:protein phosphatase 2C domain-containing protein [Nocardiopsaceae bacterium]
MSLLSTGEFARASGLSRKALRLYDELGLLTPAQVDPATGYRFYALAQLEQARLVAWLRRLGMPLATIRLVSTLPPPAAAMELTAYWAQAEAEAAARRRLATFLIDYLSGKDAVMPDAASEPLTIRYGVRSDVGLVREGNEDSAYAGGRLLAVADGMGGHAHGEVASAAAIEALRPLDTDVPDEELLHALEHAVLRAGSTLREMIEADPSLRGMGTTLTALLWSGSRLGLVHIGDSRAYLVRGGEVFQITRDHTLVQSLLDEGKITEDEVASHPKRMLLLRALDGENGFAPDLELREAQGGDRYLLSSDGLHGVVPAADISRVLLEVADPDEAAAELIRLAIDGGAPDNVTVIVADVVPAAKTLPLPTSPEPADA